MKQGFLSKREEPFFVEYRKGGTSLIVPKTKKSSEKAEF